jgi:hypothetical protein
VVVVAAVVVAVVVQPLPLLVAAGLVDPAVQILLCHFKSL